MTLKEALKSGKLFKRQGDAYYCIPFHNKNQLRSFSTNDIIADDWEIKEIKEIKISLTKNQIKAEFALQGYEINGYHFQNALQSLGFEIEESNET